MSGFAKSGARSLTMMRIRPLCHLSDADVSEKFRRWHWRLISMNVTICKPEEFHVTTSKTVVRKRNSPPTPILPSCGCAVLLPRPQLLPQSIGVVTPGGKQVMILMKITSQVK